MPLCHFSHIVHNYFNANYTVRTLKVATLFISDLALWCSCYMKHFVKISAFCTVQAFQWEIMVFGLTKYPIIQYVASYIFTTLYCGIWNQYQTVIIFWYSPALIVIIVLGYQCSSSYTYACMPLWHILVLKAVLFNYCD